MKQSKPWALSATDKLFKVEIDKPFVVTGYTEGENKYASFYRSIPVKRGDVFRKAPGGILLNGKLFQRASRPLREMEWQVPWVAKRLRVAVFLERDRIYDKKRKKWTDKYGKPYWVACDLRSYHIGCHKDAVTAIQHLIKQCLANNLCAEEEMAKGNKVIRWRCLLPKNEVAEMEEKANKTGFILDGVEVPPLPDKWLRGLEELRQKHKKGK